jgi:hypothetical protein
MRNSQGTRRHGETRLFCMRYRPWNAKGVNGWETITPDQERPKLPRLIQTTCCIRDSQETTMQRQFRLLLARPADEASTTRTVLATETLLHRRAAAPARFIRRDKEGESDSPREGRGPPEGFQYHFGRTGAALSALPTPPRPGYD